MYALINTSSRNVFRNLLQKWGNQRQLLLRSFSSLEADRQLMGTRERVGHGYRGDPGIADRADYPFPASRYKEPTPELEALKEKEKGDWRKLSLEERKTLYRASFCLTFAEFQAPTGEWKFVIAGVLLTFGIGFYGYIFHHNMLYRNTVLPDSFSHESVYAQMKRSILIHTNAQTGFPSMWDYENNKWKVNYYGFENPWEVEKQYKKLRGETVDEDA